MQKISPFLWFNSEAEQAANFYISVFKNSKILSANPLVVQFELEGQEFMAINGGPTHAGFTETISFVIDCATQEEVDYFWKKLTADGGQESRCGWLKDKFGLSWQVVPKVLPEMIGSKDREKADRAMQAMLKMNKINIEQLKQAYDGK